ncbi:hypothetical protein AKJ40_03770 [candidate division MSBL1 archaeon SCGC-AAA259M10]|uniref:Uncharacterized protein n=1 Tax=candidate division MSBL1 archaeon SCGC-AAA259M10 TaxID=1698270 RepID=A0A133UYE2_9EURY|nr:hypothetical protein AKJ40_03770 [candidate division MSBL1 archaeon SCGC-AAA259M10]
MPLGSSAERGDAVGQRTETTETESKRKDGRQAKSKQNRIHGTLQRHHGMEGKDLQSQGNTAETTDREE